MTRNIEKLIVEVDALLSVYVGKDAPSEPWGDTCNRFIALAKTLKKAKKDLATLRPSDTPGAR